MKITFCFLSIIFLKLIESHDSESSEMNRIEISPFYDTIIISDIADILDEFENNMNSPLDTNLNSESESDENIEDLLNEYQTYLDKAHKQRLIYLENKSKVKNKVPLLRHDKYFKRKTPNVKHENYYLTGFLNPNTIKYPQTPQNNFDIYIPLNTNEKYLNKPTAELRKDTTPQYSVLDKIIKNKFLPINLASSVFNPDTNFAPIKPRCCKNGQVNCKQCMTPYNSISETRSDPKRLLFGKTLSEIQQDPSARIGNNFANIDPTNDLLENTINLRVKVDVQIPSVMHAKKYYKGRYRERMIEPEETFSKEYMSSINLPVPYFNFPIPLEMFGHKKSPKFYKHDNIHEITIHKKKKSRNSNNKKHRNKIISFHSKISSAIPNVNNNTFEHPTTTTDNHGIYSTSERIIDKMFENHTNYNNIKEPVAKDKSNDTQIDENIIITLNISSKAEADKEKTIENVIDTEYTKINDFNVTTEKSLRRKRDILSHNNLSVNNTINLTVTEVQNVTNLNTSVNKIIETNVSKVVEQTNSRKMEKVMLADAEMLFWPTLPLNRSANSPGNITNIIIDRENKKEKLNMSMDMIRHNRTVALEQAIFGNVDWDDVDAVAPTFLSFVGKYIRGALTFCSEKICHSMKCEDKSCTHRTCIPEDRLNQKGHCTGSNTTDSIASLESIMDLPSSVVFKMVDILEDKMLGKLFGKVTLCINAKCITFLASKKSFLKYKCNNKETNTTGHCPNVKNAKMM